ncbi:hypothetical protein EUX48_03170 [Haemophilus haemolyticus]|uniref:Lipoprotein n=1 Tax=Haemophilus haemolyticus TaxID=726 RepID=A0A502LPT3_HAEHA|nr:cell envelope integrity protein TolA [Haemophilus haemolyticus]TPH24095.1 hypothetical protein EUX48_03170 [Haemophilus haemolyticus]
MKPTFKTTALAILVSLGAVACSSTSPSNNQQPKQVQPTNPNSQSKPNVQDHSKKSEAEQKAEEEKAKAEREAQQKTAEQKRLEEAKIKAEEAKKAKDLEEKARLEREAKEKAEEAKRLEEERIKAEEKAKLEEENRQRLERERLEKEKQSSVDARVKAELDKMPKTSDGKIKTWGMGWSDDGGSSRGYALIDSNITRQLVPDKASGYVSKLFYNSDEGEDRILLSEITVNDIQKGGEYLGVHQGSYTTKTALPKVIELDDKSFEHGSDKLIIKKADYSNKDVNYLFINNPYSSYGALFVDQDRSGLFVQPLSGDDFHSGQYIKDGVWYNNESLQGKIFTYKGNIIAKTTRAIPKTTVSVTDDPKIDGDITFKIEFKKNASDRIFDGVINSKVLGNNIKFNMTQSGGFGSILEESQIFEKAFDSDYNYRIGMWANVTDKNATEVVGDISYTLSGTSDPTYFDKKEKRQLYSDNIPKNGLLMYEGVFGATKQPE